MRKTQGRSVMVMIAPASGRRLAGIAGYAKEHGWQLMFHDRLGYAPAAWTGDGIITALRASDSAARDYVRRFRRHGGKVVDLTVECPDLRLPRVVNDHAEIGRRAARYFRERNFKSFAWFSTGWTHVHALRFNGLAEACGAAPARWVLRDDLPLADLSDWNRFQAWFRARLAAAPRPLALLAYDEADAARALLAADAAGVRVPDELAVLAVGDTPDICENQRIPISSVCQDLEGGARRAAELLDALMSGARPPAKPILIPPLKIITRRSTDAVAAADPVIRAALRFINENFAAPVGVEQISASVALPRARFSRLFTHEIGRTPGRELLRVRINAAKTLLADKSLSIKEIAARTGFCNPPHLTAKFIAATGLTPRAWRKNLAQQPAP